MEFLPPPPVGMFPHMAKHDSLDHPNGQLRHGMNSKYLQPVESHGWYLSVLINADGQPEIRSSPFLEHVSKEWMHPVAENLRQLYESRVSGNEEGSKPQMKGYRSDGNGFKPPMWSSQPQSVAPQYFSESSMPYPIQTNPKRRRVDSQPPEGQDLRMSVSGPNQSISSNRSVPHTESLGNGLGGGCDGSVQERAFLSIKVCETAKWEVWFANAFKAIQQQACRFIAKEWIKLIHPKKQSTHPYNGNYPRHHNQPSPERTRPPYWPSDVRHKEPDHIDKDARTTLLVYLLTRTPQPEITPANTDGRPGGKEIVAKDLLEVLTKKKEEYKDKWEIIEMVIHIRTELENFEEGGMDADTTLTVPDYHENTRPRSNDKKQRMKPKTPAKTEPQEAINDGDESRATSPTPPASPVGSAATPAESENEDDLSTVNASTVSRSSGPVLRPKPEGNSNHHAHMNSQATDQHQPMLIDPNPHGLDYNPHNGIHHGQSNIPNSWPTTNATDSRPTEAYPNNMLVSQEMVHPLDPTQFEHGMYTAPRPMGMAEVMSLMPYPDAQPFMFEYDRNVPYRVSNMSHDLEAQTNFLHNQYCRVYTNAQPPRH